MTKYESQAVSFEKADFVSNPKDMHLFNYHFKKSLGYHIGKQFHNLIPAVQAIVPELITLGATSFENKIERNGSDRFVWLESQSEDVYVLANKHKI
jgi:hypothetical protein